MMKIQFSNKNMTVPDRVYSHAEQRINELDHLFRGEPEAVVVFSAEDGKHVIELTIFSGTTISGWWKKPPICWSPSTLRSPPFGAS